MASAPTPDPSQQPQQPPPAGGGGTATQGGDAGGQQAGGPPPELQHLGSILTACKQMAEQYPATSAGLAKAIAGINEAASAVMSQSQQQGPSQSPPY